jgi:hypothetical protein
MNYDELGQKLVAEINAWESYQSDCVERWDQCYRLYSVDPDAVSQNTIDVGIEAYAFPVAASKSHKLVGELGVAVRSGSPVLQFAPWTSDDNLNASGVEVFVQRVLQKSRYLKELNLALMWALLANMGVMRIVPIQAGGQIVDFEAESVDPRNFMLYPPDVASLRQARTVGHRFSQTVGEIKEKIDAGQYRDVPEEEIPGHTERSQHTRVPGEVDVTHGRTIPVDRESETVECFELITSHAGKRQLVTLMRDTSTVLRAVDYPYENTWYSTYQLLCAEDRVICNVSLMSLAQQLMALYNDTMNTLNMGMNFSAFPVLVKRGGADDSTTDKVTPGEIFHLGPNESMDALAIPFNPNAMEWFIGELGQQLDQLFGMSPLSSSGMVPTKTKATVANLVAQSDRARMGIFLDSVANGVEQAGEFVLEVLQRSLSEISPQYLAVLPDDMLSNVSWTSHTYRPELTGRTADSNPEVQLAKYKMLLETALIPGSPVDVGKVVAEMVKAMELPIRPEQIMKDADAEVKAMLGEIEQSGVDPKAVIVAGLQSLTSGAGGPPGDPGIGSPAALPSGPFADPAGTGSLPLDDAAIGSPSDGSAAGGDFLD